MSTSNFPNAAVEAPNALSSRQNPTANTPKIKSFILTSGATCGVSVGHQSRSQLLAAPPLPRFVDLSHCSRCSHL
ncbi:hypothetical protein DL93DRAFT_2090015, partial [Clavulina sp. PMI_390]